MAKKKEYKMLYTHVLIHPLLFEWIIRPKALKKALENSNFFYPKRSRVTAILKDGKGQRFILIPAGGPSGDLILKIKDWNPLGDTATEIKRSENSSLLLDEHLFPIPKEAQIHALEESYLMIDLSDRPELILGRMGGEIVTVVAEITERGLKEPEG